MNFPTTITFKGHQYIKVEALTTDELRNVSVQLHEIAQMLRPSIMGSDVSQELNGLSEALVNLVRANNFLLEESAILPSFVPGNKNRIYALLTDAMEASGDLKERFQRLANHIGKWALKIDELVREQERLQDSPTRIKKPEESSQFGHLW